MAVKGRMGDLFLGSGIHYYVAARSAATAQLLPLTGNLFHHAVEMCWKAALVERRSIEHLKDRIGHNLRKLWQDVKKEFPAAGLDQFDVTVIDRLDLFERIRYPDALVKHGAGIRLEWAPFKSGPIGDVPNYEIAVNEVDELVARVFEVTVTNPTYYTDRLTEAAKAALTHWNPRAEFFMTPMKARVETERA